jgi:hypothetical protein
MKFPYYLNIVLFTVSLFFSLITDWNPPKWKDFNDPDDYLKQSTIAVKSREFYAPHQTGTFFPRPFTVPLFYKLAGSQPEVIVQMQKFIHAMAAFFLAYALMLIVNRLWLKYLALFFVYLLMSWWNILGWASQLLSESLSMSLMFCWLASFLVLWKKRTLPLLLLHILITILFSFTRDTWPYIIVLFYFLILLFAIFCEKSFLTRAIFLLICSVILFFAQLNTARVGSRNRLPLMNTIAVRILTNPQYTAWFEVRGMPDIKTLHPIYRNIDVNIDQDRHKIWNLYWNHDYKAFSDWTISEGRTTYIKFLLTHPSYFFLFNETQPQLKRIFASPLWYTPCLRGYSKLTEPVFPLFGSISSSILGIILIILYFRKREPVILFPVLLWLIFFANVFLSYNADALEVERHLFITLIAIQLIGFISVPLILDNMFRKPVTGRNVLG